MRSMGLTPDEIERRKSYVSLTPAEAKAITSARKPVHDTVDKHVEAFFGYLARIPEAHGLIENREQLPRARRLKREHVLAMVEGEYDEKYVEQRLELAQLYNKIGLEPAVFLGAFNALLTSIETVIGDQVTTLRKVGFFDVGIIVDALVHQREQVIRLQSEAIRELSTPVLQVRDRLLLIPIIGVVDSHRAQLIMENLLGAIRTQRAKAVVMDVTGVATVDSKVANHLLQTVAAARLMGAHVIVTGLSAEVAQSLVALGINLEQVQAVGDLQGGLEEAERVLAR
jgi:rsbT co-antagonist protein RsbR